MPCRTSGMPTRQYATMLNGCIRGGVIECHYFTCGRAHSRLHQIFVTINYLTKDHSAQNFN